MKQSNAGTIQEIRVGYNVADGNKARLFAPIDVSNLSQFCLQFFFKELVGDVKDSAILLSVSNDAENFFTIGENYTIFPTLHEIRDLGNSTQFIFIGQSEGVASVGWITADFVQGLLTEGIIEKIILSGKTR